MYLRKNIIVPLIVIGIIMLLSIIIMSGLQSVENSKDQHVRVNTPGFLLYRTMDSMHVYAPSTATFLRTSVVDASLPPSLYRILGCDGQGRIYGLKNSEVDSEDTIIRLRVKRNNDVIYLNVDIPRIATVDDPYDWVLVNNRPQVVQGKGHNANLLSVNSGGHLVSAALPRIPDSISSYKEWTARPSVSGSGKVTFSITGRNQEKTVVTVDIPNRKVQRLAQGRSPVWSPDGNRVAFIPDKNVHGELRVAVMDVPSRTTSYMTVWKPRNILQRFALDIPVDVRTIQWIPSTEYILCQVEVGHSLTEVYESPLFLVSTSGSSIKLPLTADPDMWCWVPVPKTGE